MADFRRDFLQQTCDQGERVQVIDMQIAR